MDINYYLADFRHDEGLRVRKDLILPTLSQDLGGGGGVSRMKLVIEVCSAENKKRNNERIYRSTGGGAMSIGYPNSNARRGRVIDEGNTTPTIDTTNNAGAVEFNGKQVRIRKLTPRECFRAQGFPDEYFERAAAVCSDSQLYKQAGNSVTVNVIYEIAKRLKLDD